MGDKPISYNVPGAKDASGLTRTQLYDAMKDGRLVYFKIGRRRLILRDDLEAFLHAHRTAEA